MFAVTCKSLRAHKTRLALTAVAVVLGVAFIAATFILTDTVDAALTGAISRAQAGDVTVRATAPYGTSTDPSAAVALTVPDTLVRTVATAPGVAAAHGSVQGAVTVLTPTGKLPATGPNGIAIGTNWIGDDRLSPMTLRTGQAPTHDDQFAIDAATYHAKHYRLGQRITVLGGQAPRTLTLVGVIGFGSADTLAGRTYAVFDDATAQRLLSQPGRWDSIAVVASPRITLADLLTSVRRTLPGGTEAVSSARLAHDQARAVRKSVGQLTTLLLVFAAIAAFVGTFIIFNTFSILIAQRTRELGLLRALGASRRQIRTAVITEAAVVGTIASALGLVAGFGLATGLQALIAAVGWALPTTAPVLQARTILVGVGVGVTATLLSSLAPARRASRVAPIAALVDDAAPDRDGTRTRRLGLGGAALSGGIAVLCYGLLAEPRHAVAVVGTGAGVSFLGVAMLVPLITAPLVRALGAPLTRTGPAGRLATASAARNPRRTAAAASALMVGVAVVAVIGTFGATQEAAMADTINNTVKADLLVTGGERGFTTAAAATVARVHGVAAITEQRTGDWHEHDVTRRLTAIDPATATRTLRVHIATGTLAALARGQLLVDTTTASARHLRLGDRLRMGFDRTGPRQLTIGGTYQTNTLLGSYLVSTATYDANYTNPVDQRIYIATTGTDPAAVRIAVTRALRDQPNLTVTDPAGFRAQQASNVGQAQNMIYVLLALSIVIAIIGIINTLALSVLERTREIGMLRAIGMTRRQLRRMIRGETLITCLLGGLLGIATGTPLAVAVTHSAERSTTGITSRIVIPTATLATVVASCALAAVLAALAPARRAVRLDAITALNA